VSKDVKTRLPVEEFRIMRFAKTDVLESFDRQDRSYRLALLCTYWIRDTAGHKPSASEKARGMLMEFRNKLVPFDDLADKLEQQSSRETLSSDFVLNQLHALIRAPFEIICDYCGDYDNVMGGKRLSKQMEVTPWFQFARIIRNAISHNFHFQYGKYDKSLLPVAWNGITLSQDMEGKPLTHGSLWHRTGYELFLEMRTFAEELPDLPL
jgi:hypothetical protein